jgi:hypothetical protein
MGGASHWWQNLAILGTSNFNLNWTEKWRSGHLAGVLIGTIVFRVTDRGKNAQRDCFLRWGGPVGTSKRWHNKLNTKSVSDHLQLRSLIVALTTYTRHLTKVTWCLGTTGRDDSDCAKTFLIEKRENGKESSRGSKTLLSTRQYHKGPFQTWPTILIKWTSHGSHRMNSYFTSRKIEKNL